MIFEPIRLGADLQMSSKGLAIFSSLSFPSPSFVKDGDTRHSLLHVKDAEPIDVIGAAACNSGDASSTRRYQGRAAIILALNIASPK
jgi:hypothetical protein